MSTAVGGATAQQGRVRCQGGVHQGVVGTDAKCRSRIEHWPEEGTDYCISPEHGPLSDVGPPWYLPSSFDRQERPACACPPPVENHRVSIFKGAIYSRLSKC